MDVNTIYSNTPDKDHSENYIRTFSGDLETLEKDGVSNLEPSPQMSAHHIETYEGDFLERIKKTHASTATVLAAEQDSLRQTRTESSHNNLLYVIFGGILLLVGIIGAYIAYTRYLTVRTPATPALSILTPIFVDEQEQISGTGSALILAIGQSTVRHLATNSIRLISVASTTGGSVFSALPISAPDILLRNVNTDGSMAGIVSAGGNQSPFFILSVSSYSNTFSGMLSWEKGMAISLKALFPEYPVSPVMEKTGTTTPIVATSTPYIQLSFHDETVNNHDVRVYRDSVGRSVLMYGYWNQTTLIIARDSAAFTEILKRLAISRAQ